MTPARCDAFHGDLAMEALGLLSGDERVRLMAHVDGCADCRQELASLTPLRGALAGADPGRLEEPSLPRHLEDSVVNRLRTDNSRRRARRRTLTFTGAVAACLVAAVVGLLAAGSFAGRGPKTLALHGPAGVQAGVSLVNERWGTQVQFHESGQPGGQVYTVSLVATTGRWWSAGTYRTVSGQSVRVDLGCALTPSEIVAVYVRDSAGRMVLQSD